MFFVQLGSDGGGLVQAGDFAGGWCRRCLPRMRQMRFRAAPQFLSIAFAVIEQAFLVFLFVWRGLIFGVFRACERDQRALPFGILRPSRRPAKLLLALRAFDCATYIATRS